MSVGEALASSAVIATTAERSASGAEPKTRIRERPPSFTLFSINDACRVPAQMIGAD